MPRDPPLNLGTPNVFFGTLTAAPKILVRRTSFLVCWTRRQRNRRFHYAQGCADKEIDDFTMPRDTPTKESKISLCPGMRRQRNRRFHYAQGYADKEIEDFIMPRDTPTKKSKISLPYNCCVCQPWRNDPSTSAWNSSRF